MYLEDGFSFTQVGQVDIDLTVETSGTQQSRVEHIGTVRGCEDDHTAVGAEAVHLGEQGIQGVLTFIVTAHGGVLRTGSSHSINLIDEDDTR